LTAQVNAIRDGQQNRAIARIRFDREVLALEIYNGLEAKAASKTD